MLPWLAPAKPLCGAEKSSVTRYRLQRPPAAFALVDGDNHRPYPWPQNPPPAILARLYQRKQINVSPHAVAA
jgi:hypothetical protein